MDRLGIPERPHAGRTARPVADMRTSRNSVEVKLIGSFPSFRVRAAKAHAADGPHPGRPTDQAAQGARFLLLCSTDTTLSVGNIRPRESRATMRTRAGRGDDD